MNVTLMTDASHCPNTLAGGYGFWVVSERGGWPGGGMLPTGIPTTTLAEMHAIIYSLKRCLKAERILSGDTVLIQTDCQAAIDHFRGMVLKQDAVTKDVVGQLRNLTKQHRQIELEFRHVKGHAPGLGRRYKANDMCDMRAKQFMRAERDRILKEQQMKESQDAQL